MNAVIAHDMATLWALAALAVAAASGLCWPWRGGEDEDAWAR